MGLKLLPCLFASLFVAAPVAAQDNASKFAAHVTGGVWASVVGTFVFNPDGTLQIESPDHVKTEITYNLSDVGDEAKLLLTKDGSTQSCTIRTEDKTLRIYGCDAATILVPVPTSMNDVQKATFEGRWWFGRQLDTLMVEFSDDGGFTAKKPGAPDLVGNYLVLLITKSGLENAGTLKLTVDGQDAGCQFDATATTIVLSGACPMQGLGVRAPN